MKPSSGDFFSKEGYMITHLEETCIINKNAIHNNQVNKDKQIFHAMKGNLKTHPGTTKWTNSWLTKKV